ncbi:lytic murein transglycosylase [Candidatus Wolfebacteria bacterium]|nr:lytic murein transglycosylase [Candidatus Wolfebacteria bacterium]
MKNKIFTNFIKTIKSLKIKNKVKKVFNSTFRFFVSNSLKNFFGASFFILVIFSFVFNLAIIPIFKNVLAAPNSNEERQALQAELEELERQISEYESTIGEYQKQGNTLKTEIGTLEAQISKLNLQIRAINLTLTNLDSEIVSTQKQIEKTKNEINSNKENLSQTLQTLYENDNKSLIEVLFKNPQLSDFFTDLNNLLVVQDNLRLLIEKIAESHEKLINQKEVLALERADAAALKAYQDSQKTSIKQTQNEKDNLLKITKGKESEYQKLLTETQKTAAEIRQRIFQLLGGGELEFGQAYELALMAEKATGIRAALVLAVLDRESALGKNVGQCDYKTAMHPTRDIPAFLKIIDELGLKGDLEAGTIKVSCAISSDGAYGGAMGPAQFIPSTWQGYKDRVSEITGNKPASPWSNIDAFVATALYLKDSYNSSACVDYGNQYSHILPKQTLQERCAAAKYYAGSRWFTYRFAYGDKVLTSAQRFEDDIAILLGN